MYRARAVKVMIASPGDVGAARQVVRDVLQEWNFVHSEDKQLVLMPVGWDTHAQPAMGDRPQALINKQVLQGCDLLIAIFWTRLGSPTGKSDSGTVEEIEEHINAGKPAMIYFSQEPVRPDSVDDAQYRALKEFKKDCESRGLVETYESIQEFREKFSRQLAQTVITNFNVGSEDDILEFAASQSQRGRDPLLAALTAEARELLVQAAQDPSGEIMRTRSMQGLTIQSNGRVFTESGDPRSEAKWEAALRLLVELGLTQDLGYKSEIFRLTDLGYQTADRVQGGGKPA